MAERWDEQRDRTLHEDRNYRGSEQERGMVNRGADEVRSWFGDDDAARRRRMDELRDERDRGARPSHTVERSWDRARDTFRDTTDRDHDGRRGFAEWQDNDRSRDRFGSARDIAPASGTARDYGDRPYVDRTSYSDDRYSSARWNQAAPATGQYAGRGPRGYKRGDERIREDVCDRLTDESRIDASDIDVTVADGEVTLAGSVRSREEKRFAEDLIERISGVRDVNNHLKVKSADEVIGTARSGSSMLGLTETPPPPSSKK